MLGMVKIEDYLRKPEYKAELCESRECGGCLYENDNPCDEWHKWWEQANNKLDWVIVGAESGPGLRWCNNTWVGSIAEQCKAANVSIFVKQLHKLEYQKGKMTIKAKVIKDINQFPKDLQIREYPK